MAAALLQFLASVLILVVTPKVGVGPELAKFGTWVSGWCAACGTCLLIDHLAKTKSRSRRS